MLAGGFSESERRTNLESLAQETEDYDYESDSDLEDCNNDEASEQKSSLISPSTDVGSVPEEAAVRATLASFDPNVGFIACVI